ncbi:hypothetical protein [Mycolicibacterium sp. XJ1904]
MNPSLDGLCTSQIIPWSIISSSTSNATLAAILAGFMIPAIIFLLGSGHDASSHTVALFASGFLVLGLNSYIFGTISAPPVDGDGNIRAGGEYVCSLSWTQGMAASGMLGVGSVLLVAGLTWMFAHHIKLDTRDPKWADDKWLVVLGGLLVSIIIAASSILLARTSVTYFNLLKAYFGLEPPGWVTASSLHIGSYILSGVCAVAILARTFGWLSMKSGKQVVLTGIASAIAAILAIVGPIFASVTAENARANPASVSTSIMALVLCLFVPAIVFLALSFAAPGIRRKA